MTPCGNHNKIQCLLQIQPDLTLNNKWPMEKNYPIKMNLKRPDLTTKPITSNLFKFNTLKHW